MRERRAFIRVPVGVETTYQMVSVNIPPRLGLSEDLSLGGMRLSQVEALEPGRSITMNVSLPEGQISLRGIVIWCRQAQTLGRQSGYQSGLRWLEVTPVAQARLNAFLTHYSTAPRPTSTPTQSSSSGGISVLWWRAIFLGVLGFILLIGAGQQWCEQARLNTEIIVLRAKVRSYERQLEFYLGRRFFKFPPVR